MAKLPSVDVSLRDALLEYNTYAKSHVATVHAHTLPPLTAQCIQCYIQYAAMRNGKFGVQIVVATSYDNIL